MPWAVAAGVGSALVGGLISSSASHDAANAQAQSNAQAIAEQRREYDQSRSDHMPWLTTGTSALNRLAGIYGLDTFNGAAPAGTPAAGTGGALSGIPGAMSGGFTPANMNGGFGTGTVAGAPNPGSVTKGEIPNLDPNATFYQSPDYKFRFGQGIQGVDAGAAARGTLDSGATRKAEISYAGNLASGEFNNYANRLSALAGVGQTAADSNSQAGSNEANYISQLLQSTGQARASSYLANGGGWANTIGNIGGQIGGLLTNTGNTTSQGMSGGGGQFYYGPAGGWGG